MPKIQESETEAKDHY